MNQESLKKRLNYCPDSGIFTWREGEKHGKPGGIAGAIVTRGYVRFRFEGKKYLAHRLAWLYVYGYLPENEIDHINCIRHDNRIVNLREATRAENSQNIRNARINNKSGVLGVKFVKNVYVANIAINKKIIYLGQFKTKEEAGEAYLNAKKRIHPFFLESAAA